jgi:hypothetical protein
MRQDRLSGRMLKLDWLIDKDSSALAWFDLEIRRFEGLKKNQAVIVENPPQTHYDRHYQEVHPCLQ